MATAVRFGDFQLDFDTGELFRNGTPVSLERQPARALMLLASRPGALVTREELRRAIWDADTFVDFERGLNYCIRHLRAAFGDDARRPRYIETIPRQGYRFVAEVRHDTGQAPIVRTAADDVPRSFSGRSARWIAGQAAALAAGVLLTALVCSAPASRPARMTTNRHHDTAAGLTRAAHDLVFGPARRDSAHHRATVGALRALHDLVF